MMRLFSTSRVGLSAVSICFAELVCVFVHLHMTCTVKVSEDSK